MLRRTLSTIADHVADILLAIFCLVMFGLCFIFMGF